MQIDRTKLRGMKWEDAVSLVRSIVHPKNKPQISQEQHILFISDLLNTIKEKTSRQKFDKWPFEFIPYTICLAEAISQIENTQVLQQFYNPIKAMIDQALKNKNYHLIPSFMFILSKFLNSGHYNIQELRVDKIMASLPLFLKDLTTDCFIDLCFISSFFTVLSPDIFENDIRPTLVQLLEPLYNLLIKLCPSTTDEQTFPIIIDDKLMSNIPQFDNSTLWSCEEEDEDDDELDDCLQLQNNYSLVDNIETRTVLLVYLIGIIFQCLYESNNFSEELEDYIDFRVKTIDCKIEYEGVLLPQEIYTKYTKICLQLFAQTKQLNTNYNLNLLNAASCILVNSIRILKEKYNDQTFFKSSMDLFPHIFSYVDLSVDGSVGFVESIYSSFQILLNIPSSLFTDEQFLFFYQESVKFLLKLRDPSLNRVNAKDITLTVTKIVDTLSMYIRVSDLSESTLNIIIQGSKNIFGSTFLYSDCLFITRNISDMSQKVLPIIKQEFETLETFSEQAFEMAVHSYTRIFYVLGSRVKPHFHFFYSTMWEQYFESSFYLVLATSVARPPIQRDVASFIVDEKVCMEYQHEIDEVFTRINEIFNETEEDNFVLVGQSLTALEWYCQWSEIQKLPLFIKHNAVIVNTLLEYMNLPFCTEEDSDIFNLVLKVLVMFYQLPTTLVEVKNKIKTVIKSDIRIDEDEDMAQIREDILSGYVKMLI